MLNSQDDCVFSSFHFTVRYTCTVFHSSYRYHYTVKCLFNTTYLRIVLRLFLIFHTELNNTLSKLNAFSHLLTKFCYAQYVWLLTKCEVNMAGYWPSSFFACLWTETKSRSINSRKKTEANSQPS